MKEFQLLQLTPKLCVSGSPLEVRLMVWKQRGAPVTSTNLHSDLITHEGFLVEYMDSVGWHITV